MSSVHFMCTRQCEYPPDFLVVGVNYLRCATELNGCKYLPTFSFSMIIEVVLDLKVP